MSAPRTSGTRTVDEVRESEAELAGIVAISADAIIFVDAEQRITLFNKGAEEIFGHGAAEVMGQPLDILLPESARQIHRRHLETFDASPVAARRMGERREIFGRRKGGELFPAEASISKLTVGGKRVFAAVLRDVSERRRAEAEKTELLEREREARALAQAAERRTAFLARAHLVLDASLDYGATLARLAHLIVPELADICLVDILEEDGTIRRLESATSQPALHSLTGTSFQYLLDPKRQYLSRSAIESGTSVLLPMVSVEELKAVSQNDAHLRLLEALAPRSLISVPIAARGQILGGLTLLAATGRAVYGEPDLALVEEVGRRAGLAIDNARLYRQSQRASRLRDEVLGVVSHDLRNPLAAISMCAVTVLENGDDAEQVRRHAETIVDAADAMRQLLADLLDVASIEGGRLSISRKPTDAVVLVVRAMSHFEHAAKERSVHIEADVPERLRLVSVDASRMLQLLSNLIGNALKFTPAGGRVVVGAVDTAAGVRVEVRDSGPGIPADELPFIFDRFWHAQRSSSVRGTGLGLAIAKGIAEAHGTLIAVESTVGAGSTFSVVLPYAAVQAPEPAEGSRTPRGTEAQLS